MAQWHYIIRPANNLPGWVAFAKQTPFVSGGDMNEPGDIWFEFAPTEAEARAKIEAEVRAMMN